MKFSKVQFVSLACLVTGAAPLAPAAVRNLETSESLGDTKQTQGALREPEVQIKKEPMLMARNATTGVRERG
jgi:hypothetical protein